MTRSAPKAETWGRTPSLMATLEQDDERTDGWPFFAPSRLSTVERGLDLAGVKEGDRVVDLGCGDGQILVAAARRGARVAGVELSAELVERARAALEANGFEGDVVQGDVFEFPLDADVLFTYLSPATLQRLEPRFQAAEPGTRLVTIDFEAPGLVAAKRQRGLWLYRLPARHVRPVRRAGWTTAGALVAAAPEHESLTCIELRHPGGPIEVSITDDLAESASFLVGVDVAEPGQPVAIDIRWEAFDAGTLVTGEIEVKGVGTLPVIALYDESDHGLWELSDEGCENLVRRVKRKRRWRNVEELVEAAEGD